MSLFDNFFKKRSGWSRGTVPVPIIPEQPKKGSSHKWNVGDRIEGRYEIHRIKKGGMGIVFLCYDHKFKEPLALKTFQDKYLADEAARARFLWEAQAWVKLEKHPNIVSAKKYVADISGKPYIFLEYVPGDENLGADLSGWIARGCLNSNDAIDFAIQFCRGMEHAETKFREMEKPFVHRDIKPGNIMVTKDKTVKVTDFGLVKTFMGTGRDMASETNKDIHASSKRHDFSIVGSICGTPPYMSPEQCRGETEIDTRSDIYSFGCVLYEMLAGRPPFKCDTNYEYYAHHIKIEPDELIKLAPDIPQDLNCLVMKCLKKEPTERHQNFNNLKEDLSKIFFQRTGHSVKPEETTQQLKLRERELRGISLCELGLFDAAVREYKEILRITEDASVHNNLGNALLAMGHPEEAIEEFREALRINPEIAEAHYNIGNSFADKGLTDEAIRHYREAIRIDPDFKMAHNNLGIDLYDKGLIDEAINEFREVLRIDPKDATVHNNLGNAFSSRGLLEKATEEYEEAININPEFAQAHFNLGCLLGENGNIDGAIREFREALRINPNYSSAQINLERTLIVKESMKRQK